MLYTTVQSSQLYMLHDTLGLSRPSLLLMRPARELARRRPRVQRPEGLADRVVQQVALAEPVLRGELLAPEADHLIRRLSAESAKPYLYSILYTTLYYTIYYILYHTKLYYTILYYTILHYTILCYTIYSE